MADSHDAVPNKPLKTDSQSGSTSEVGGDQQETVDSPGAPPAVERLPMNAWPDSQATLVVSVLKGKSIWKSLVWPQGRLYITNDFGSDKNVEKCLQSFSNSFEQRGFQVEKIETDFEATLRSVTEAEAHKQSVLLLVRSQPITEQDLQRLKECKAEQTFVISCQIGGVPQNIEMETWSFQERLPNIFLLSVVYQNTKTGSVFLTRLHTLVFDEFPKDSIDEIVTSKKGNLLDNKKYGGIGRGLSNPSSLLFQAKPSDTLLSGDAKARSAQLDRLSDETLKRLTEDNEDPFEKLVYRNRGNGRALIINNIVFDPIPPEQDEAGQKKQKPKHRTSGSLIDCQNLFDLFTRLGYEVELKFNRNASEMIGDVEEFANDSRHGDSCALVVMTHGKLGWLLGTDNKPVEESRLLKSMYYGKKIKGKPRLVLFQACRVDGIPESADGAGKDSHDTHAEELAREVVGAYNANAYGEVPTLASEEPPNDQCGLIVAHSTSPGDFSARNKAGSRFVHAFCACCYKWASSLDLVSMVQRVNFVTMRGFPKPDFDDAVPQLPWWSIQTDRMFFVVNTEKRADCVPVVTSQEESREP